MRAAVESFGGLDIVIHNASSGLSGVPAKCEEIDDERWGEQFGIALDAAFFLAQASFGFLRDTGRGRFIVLSSAQALHGGAMNPAYAAVKNAQRGFVKALAREWGPFNIPVNGIAPAAETDATKAHFERHPQLREQLYRAHPAAPHGGHAARYRRCDRGAVQRPHALRHRAGHSGGRRRIHGALGDVRPSSLAGKVALVTGGCSGIGRSTVLAFAEAGARVVVSDVDVDAGLALVGELDRNGARGIFVKADVTRADEVERLMESAIDAFGRLDIAHNNVGGGTPNPSLTELSEAEWDRTFAAQSEEHLALHEVRDPAHDQARRRRNCEHGCARRPGGHGKGVARLFGREGRRDSSDTACRGGVRETQRSHQRGIAGSHGDARSARGHDARADRRGGRPMPSHSADGESRGAGERMVWLCSDQASFVNGVTVPVDGGWAAR